MKYFIPLKLQINSIIKKITNKFYYKDNQDNILVIAVQLYNYFYLFYLFIQRKGQEAANYVKKSFQNN